MWYRDPKFCPTTRGPAAAGTGVRFEVAADGVSAVGGASGAGVANRVASRSESASSGVVAGTTVSAESVDTIGVGVRTLAATAGALELDRAPQTGQRPPSAGAELPHWGQFMMVL